MQTEEALKERSILFARALFRLDKERAKALVKSLDEETPFGIVVHTAAKWSTPGSPQRIHLMAEDGYTTVASFSENDVYAGGYLTPLGKMAADYLKKCIKSKKTP